MTPPFARGDRVWDRLTGRVGRVLFYFPAQPVVPVHEEAEVAFEDAPGTSEIIRTPTAYLRRID